MSTIVIIKGNIKLINETQTFDSGFQKREFVVTTNDMYPQDIKIEMIKDGCAELDKFKVGNNVAVSTNIRGNEYNGKYYVNLQGWKIEEDTDTGIEAPKKEEKSDLPF
jgi:hypothetical protein